MPLVIATSSEFFTAYSGIGIVLIFAIILLVSRSNSPERYEEHEYRVMRRQANREYYGSGYDDDFYGLQRRHASRGGGAVGVVIFVTGALLLHAFDFRTVGIALMLIGGLCAVLSLLAALSR